MRKWSVLSALLFFSAANSQASETSLLTSPQTNKAIIFGSVDIAYNYLSKRNHFTSGIYDRQNDLSLNGVALQQLNVTFSYLPTQGIGGLLNLLIGQDANLLAPTGFNPNVFSIQNIGATVPQAFIQYSVSNTTIQLGEQQSLAGIEAINYVQNPQFSRSLLTDFAQPGTHLGARLTQAMNEKLSVIAGINNGWDTIRSPGRLKSLEGGIIYTPSAAFSLSVNGYSGIQYVSVNQTGGRETQRHALDFFATWYATPSLSFAINGDYALQAKAALPYNQIGRAVWQGIATYVNYTWRDKWLASMRAELFDDTNGYTTGVPQNLRELTLTFAYSPFKNTQIRAETRRDFSNVNAYVSKNNSSTSNSIQAYSLDLLFAF